MALMVLKRLPTDQELSQNAGNEAHAFLDAFNNKSVSGFIAEVDVELNVDGNKVIDLDGWRFSQADWFSLVE